MKKVTIIQTGSPNPKVIETNATTWDGLLNDLSSHSVTFSPTKMKAIIGESRHTLESPNASLPATDFSLFLMVKKSKAGSEISEMTYRECRNAIKIIIDTANDNAAAKLFFSDGKKNYTQTSTQYMKSKLYSWRKKNIVPEEVPEEKVQEVSEEVVEQTDKDSNDYVKAEAIDIITEVRDNLKRYKKQILKVGAMPIEDLYTLKVINKIVNSLYVVRNENLPTIDELKNEFDDVKNY